MTSETKGDNLRFSLRPIDVVFRCPLISPYVSNISSDFEISRKHNLIKKVKQINEGT